MVVIDAGLIDYHIMGRGLSRLAGIFFVVMLRSNAPVITAKTVKTTSPAVNAIPVTTSAGDHSKKAVTFETFPLYKR